MKKTIYFLALVAFAMPACRQLDFDEDFQTSVVKNKEISKFNVTLSNVNTLVNIWDKNDTVRQLGHIEPLAYLGDTLLYVVNYKDNQGWRIVSGDRRTTSVLASAEDGAFQLKGINPGVGNWLVELADNISALKQTGEQDTTMGDYALWANIDLLQQTQSKSAMAKNAGLQRVSSYEEGTGGYWELYDMTSVVLPSTQVGPLLRTKWGQDSPWNTCVPVGRYTGIGCPTGCVAVAGAQMLYFLHYDIGVPTHAFTTGYCWGYSQDKNDKNYGFSFSNETSTAWDKMDTHRWYDLSSYKYINTTGTHLAAILMGWIGMNVKMDYTPEGSSSSTKDDLTPFFNNIGISCTYKEYNSTEVRQSLQNRKPVVLRAYGTRDPVRFIWITWGYTYSDGHAFVADGYETKRTKYTYHYRWVDDSGNSLPTEMMPVKSQNAIPPKPLDSFKTEEYVTATNLLIINWGYDGIYDSGRYYFDGNWAANGYDHQYERGMLIGFSKK
ncbi:MAG: C10 family peptidase [Paludibacteraceae bacterium]